MPSFFTLKSDFNQIWALFPDIAPDSHCLPIYKQPVFVRWSGFHARGDIFLKFQNLPPGGQLRVVVIVVVVLVVVVVVVVVVVA